MRHTFKSFFGQQQGPEEVHTPKEQHLVEQQAEYVQQQISTVCMKTRQASVLLTAVTREEQVYLEQHLPHTLGKHIQLPESIFSSAQTLIVGDMNGSLGMQISHLIDAGVVDRETLILLPTTQKKSLMFLGDILADRTMQGLPCMNNMHLLRKAGYEIHVLIGNHDQWFLSYLFFEHLAHKTQTEQALQNIVLQCQMLGQGKGLLELLPFFAEDHHGEAQTGLMTQLDQWTILEEEREHICARIKEEQPDWYGELLQMSYYLFEPKNGNLYLHTPPTMAIVQALVYLLSKEKYSYTLEEVLHDGTLEDVGNTFAHTGVRVNNNASPQHTPYAISGDLWKKLAHLGVKKIFFGHDYCEDMNVSDYFPEAGSIKQYACDGGAWKNTEHSFKKRSLLGIQPDGTVFGSRNFGHVEQLG